MTAPANASPLMHVEQNVGVEAQARTRVLRQRIEHLRFHKQGPRSGRRTVHHEPGKREGEGERGMAAGGGDLQYTSWGSYSLTRANDDSANLDIGTHIFSLGLDAIGDSVAVGGYLSYTHDDIEATGATVDAEGISFGPYGAWFVNDYLSFDGAVGGSFTFGDPGSQDSEDYFISSNINLTKWWGNLGLEGRAGVLYARADPDGAADSDFGQQQLGIRGSYWLPGSLPNGWNALPFGRVELYNDFVGPNEDTEWLVGFGVEALSSGPWSFSFEYAHTTGRDDFRQHNLLMSAHLAF